MLNPGNNEPLLPVLDSGPNCLPYALGSFIIQASSWEPHLANVQTRQCSGGHSINTWKMYPGYTLNMRAYVSHSGSVHSEKPPGGATQGFELDALPVLCCISEAAQPDVQEIE